MAFCDSKSHSFMLTHPLPNRIDNKLIQKNTVSRILATFLVIRMVSLKSRHQVIGIPSFG